MTRFCAHLKLPVLERDLGIGIGHQDVTVRQQNNMTLMGLGSIEQIHIPLDMRDPDFDQRCWARGMDPEEIRRKHSAG